jgi:hypothetical protein
MKQLCFIAAAAAGFFACGGESADAPPDGAPSQAAPGDDSSGPALVDSPDAASGPTGACDAKSAPVCTAWNARSVCINGAWTKETCVAGEGCLRGACVKEQCSDECTLGEGTCSTFDMKSNAWDAGDAKKSLHDRAREHLRWLRKASLTYGGVGDSVFSDPGTYANRAKMDGTGDSALWTGTYLAAEAWRLLATGSPDARAHAKALVETLHLWFNVSPSPGALARFVRPAGNTSIDVGIDCTKDTHHCGVSYGGKEWDYNGHVSRDQYQGVMLGYALAYDALGPTEEATRALIREDVIVLLDELMKEREVDAKIIYKGTTYPKFKIKTRYMVVVDEELDDGAILLAYDGSEDGSWKGFQEFIPDLAPMFKQIPLLGFVSPSSIPRTSSAIMLASFFRIGLHVTDGVSTLANKRAAIESFYAAHVSEMLPIASQWTEGGDKCGGHYYANNISMQPMYNWARLETVPSARDSAHSIVKDKMWPAFASHKNSFFTFLSASNMTSPDSEQLTMAREQLSQFPEPPVVRRHVDLLNDPRYSERDPECGDDRLSRTKAVDVKDRVTEGFIWQRDPWTLYDGGDPSRVYPGVDYLSAYYLGLRHGLIDEDAAGRCNRLK